MKLQTWLGILGVGAVLGLVRPACAAVPVTATVDDQFTVAATTDKDFSFDYFFHCEDNSADDMLFANVIQYNHLTHTVTFFDGTSTNSIVLTPVANGFTGTLNGIYSIPTFAGGDPSDFSIQDNADSFGASIAFGSPLFFFAGGGSLGPAVITFDTSDPIHGGAGINGGVFAIPGAPEMDAQTAAVPLALGLCTLLLVADRRRERSFGA